MAAPILVPCLVTLRAEFNKLAPNRDKGADGWIGDAAHQKTVSDHNPDDTPGVATPYTDADTIAEVHAIDIDKDLGSGLDLDDYVERIRLNHLHGRDNRLQNIIWRDRVASRSWGWTWDPRPGIGHFDHGHFSARYTTAQESDTRPWGVYTPPAPVVEEDTMDDPTIAKLAAAIGKATVDELISRSLGSSGPNVGVVLQTGVYQNSGKILTAVEEIAAKLPAPTV